ncbi:MAG: polysaccharide pyruvyl transferase CsaB [Clostridia bacterium]
MYRVLISGYYGFNNIGDESILRTVLMNLRENFDDIDITILSHNPQDTAEKYGVHAVERMSLPKVLKAIKDCDLLIFGGGSLLQDVTSNSSIFYYLFVIRMALLFRKKILLYSQGVGPIRSAFNRRLTARYLKKVDEIAVRDEASANLLRDIGVPGEKIAVTADPVMRIHRADPKEGKEIFRSIGLEKNPGRPIVGWSIKSADLSSPFLEEIAKSIRWLEETYQVDSVLIPFHYEQDAAVVNKIAERLDRKVYCIREKYLSDEILSIIGNLDCLVGVRLHSLIFAAIMEVPSIGISYDPKVDAFMDSIGRSCISGTDDFSLEKFQSAYCETMLHGDEILRTTAEKTAELKARLESYDDRIRAVVDRDRAEEMVFDAEPLAEVSEKKPAVPKKTGVAAAIGGVMMVTILAKVFGILRESIQANVFGALDAFYASYNKTIYLFTTVAYAMCIAAVPIITKAMTENRKKGEYVANNLVTFSLLLSFIGLLLWEVISLPPLSNVFLPAMSGDTLIFVRIMALTLPVIIATYLMVAVFQSMDHFALQGSMSLPYSVFLILILIFFMERESILLYVIAVSAAWLLQYAMTIPYAVKERYFYRPVARFGETYIKDFTKMAIVTIVTTSAYLFCYLTDASHAEQLGAGVTSAFYYADKIFTPLTTTFIYSISAVMFPKLSRKFTKSNTRDYMKYVWSITSNTLIIVFPVSVILMVLGGPIVKVLFESGNFTAASTVETTTIFVMYTLGMAGFSVIDLMNKSFLTMNRLFAPFVISIGIILLNMLLDIVFGFSGYLLALSTAAAMTVGAVITVIVMFRNKESAGIVRFGPILKSILLSVVIGVIAWLLKDAVLFPDDGKILLVLKSLCIGGIAVLVFVGGSYLLRLKEITDVVAARRKPRK